MNYSEMKRFILTTIFFTMVLCTVNVSAQEHHKSSTHPKASSTSTQSVSVDTQIIDRRKTVDTAYERKVNHKAYLSPPDTQTIDRRMTVDTAYERKVHHTHYK
jgi:hypothetical protein